MQREYRELCQEWDVPAVMPVLEWVRSNFYFSKKIGAFAGFWNRELFGYLDAILQALVDPDVEEVVLMLGTQMGKTACLCAIIAYFLVCEGAPSLIACPDEDSAKEHQRSKMIPHLRMVKALAHKIKPDSKLNKKNIDLGDRIVYYGWSGAPWTVSGRSCALVAVTEVNLHSRKKSGEGDPVKMARDRAKAFARSKRKILIEGKCTVDGECRLTKAFEESNQQQLQVPCPHCGEYQYLERGEKEGEKGLKWTFDSNGEVVPESVHYLCCNKECKKPINPDEKPKMMRRLRWVPKGQTCNREGHLQGTPLRSKRISGFQAGSIYSNVLSWIDYAQAFVAAAKEGIEAIKNFVQSWDAKAFKYSLATLNAKDVLDHCGDYQPGQQLLCEPLAILMATDVQKDHLWYVVRAFSYMGESWLMRYGRADNFVMLEEIEKATFHALSGTPHGIYKNLIDSGDGNRQQEIYDYCAGNWQVRQPIKGGHQYTQSSIVRVSPIQGMGEMKLWNIDKGFAMDSLFDMRLKIKKGDPGHWWLPADNYVQYDYIRSMLSWQREPKKGRSGIVKTQWVSKSDTFEHLSDCESYLEAAAAYYQLNLLPKPQMTAEQIASEEKAKRESQKPQPTATRRDGRGWWESNRGGFGL